MSNPVFAKLIVNLFGGVQLERMKKKSDKELHSVVIVGGGFAGLAVAKGMKKAPVKITLIDKSNHHLFQPLLYQVATGGLSPADVASPLRYIFKRQKNVSVVLGEVAQIDERNQLVLTADGSFRYDTLVIAAGSRASFFGNKQWQKNAVPLKSVEDALEMRSRILGCFERLEAEGLRKKKNLRARFMIVGGGPTGVELAGAIAELARDTLQGEFSVIAPEDSEIIIVEAGPKLLAGYPDKLSERAKRDLEAIGVTPMLNCRVEDISFGSVALDSPKGSVNLRVDEVFWAAGVRAASLNEEVAGSFQVKVDEQGRIQVKDDLSLEGFPQVFVIGDAAAVADPLTNEPLPGVASVAMQQGKYIARVIRGRLSKKCTGQFKYKNPGSLAVIGRAAAIADLGRLRFAGYPAWLIWVFVHIMNLVEFENRVLVTFQWGWNYFTKNRSARLLFSYRNWNVSPRPEKNIEPQTMESSDNYQQGESPRSLQRKSIEYCL